MADEKTPYNIKWKVTAGIDVPSKDIVSFVVDLDLDQAGMVVLVLRNDDHQYTKGCEMGDTLKIEQVGGKVLFSGKVAGLEPQYKAGGETRLVVRGFDDLHAKLQGKKSKTYQDKNDEAIIKEALGLSIEFAGPKVTHEHVYQHNQSDLEFTRLRAARLGCHVWMKDGKVMVKRPELDRAPVAEYKLFENPATGDRIISFNPRQTSATTVGQFTTNSWDPKTKTLTTANAKAEDSPLGDRSGSTAAGSLKAQQTYGVQEPVRSQEEAKALAEAKRNRANMAYMEAAAECLGDTKLQPGEVVQIKVNRDDADKFNGKYFVTGATHRYTNSTPNGGGGYLATLRLARDAEGKKL